MKLLSVFLLSLLLTGNDPLWLHDIDAAKEVAAKNHQAILLNFSGSDWCGPCIRMKREIFQSDVFIELSDKLVLVNADFPRMKKNQPAKEIKLAAEKLAERYNKEGNFPYTVLLNEKGEVLKTWDGLPDESAAAFTEEIKSILASLPAH